MNETYRRYPIGIQNFEDLRNNNCVYIDKTALIYQLTHTTVACFLNRPRRFIPYEIDHRKVVKVGVNFDSSTRTIGEWKIEESAV